MSTSIWIFFLLILVTNRTLSDHKHISLSPSQPDPSGSAVVIADDDEIYSLNGGWHIDTDEDEGASLLLRMDDSWQFYDGYTTNLYIEIDGFSPMWFDGGDLDCVNYLLIAFGIKDSTTNTLAQYFSVALNMKNTDDNLIYPQCGIEAPLPHPASGNITYELNKDVPVQYDNRWDRISNRGDWELMQPQVPLNEEYNEWSLKFYFEREIDSDILTFSYKDPMNGQICDFQNVLFGKGLELYISADTEDANFTVTQIHLEHDYHLTEYPTSTPTTSEPTSQPTTSEPTTSEPSSNPTHSPATSEPTANPTHSPTTANPTHSPTTAEPTANPTTNMPSQSPTANPTDSPTTAEPTANPTTSMPSHSPTHSPTTDEPTKSPTNAPTNAPTTKYPTDEPTKDPTKSPTDSPSQSPTTHSPTYLRTTSGSATSEKTTSGTTTTHGTTAIPGSTTSVSTTSGATTSKPTTTSQPATDEATLTSTTNLATSDYVTTTSSMSSTINSASTALLTSTTNQPIITNTNKKDTNHGICCSCLSVSGDGGCRNDEECENLICDNHRHDCCNNQWDDECVSIADTICDQLHANDVTPTTISWSSSSTITSKIIILLSNDEDREEKDDPENELIDIQFLIILFIFFIILGLILVVIYRVARLQKRKASDSKEIPVAPAPKESNATTATTTIELHDAANFVHKMVSKKELMTYSTRSDNYERFHSVHPSEQTADAHSDLSNSHSDDITDDSINRHRGSNDSDNIQINLERIVTPANLIDDNINDIDVDDIKTSESLSDINDRLHFMNSNKNIALPESKPLRSPIVVEGEINPLRYNSHIQYNQAEGGDW